MIRFTTAFINIVAAIIAIVTISMVQVEFSNTNTQAIVNSPSFEETVEFRDLLNERMDEVFTLISLKNVFETNGELNHSALVAESLDKANGIKKWTVNDCLNEARIHGLTINNDYKLTTIDSAETVPFSKNVIYNFMLKLYPSQVRVGAQNEEAFLTEFMTTLSKYYKASHDLSKDLSNFKYIAKFRDALNEKELIYTNTNLSEREILDSKYFARISSIDNIISSNFSFINTQTLTNAKQNNPHPDMDFSLFYAIDSNYPLDDAFANYNLTYTNTKNRFSTLLTISILSCLLFIFTLITYMVQILRSKKDVEESKSLFLQIPTELYIFFYIFEVALLILITNRLISTSTLFGYNISRATANFYVLAVYIPTIILIEIFALKYSNDTLTPASIKALKENAEDVNNTINPRTLFFGTLVPILAFIIISIYLIFQFIKTNDTGLLIIAFFIFISTLSFSIYVLYLFHAFNEAINVETRSNEMRSTLITNVTHDIKTPLTSILNYAEIITDEIKTPHENSKESLLEYSKVLINKSRRLNELINDLIFDSKISSGNIELDMQKIDLDAFLNQCIAEFSDRLEEKGLKILYECATKNPFVAADSSHLYRVFQNLFSNIYKYALENSRIYIDLKSRKSKTTITIKNIQKEKLEVNIDTLKNRFVRGSKSRSTEGFGLGLSITDNLIKSMGGTFEIKSVKDQFTTIITFLQYDS